MCPEWAGPQQLPQKIAALAQLCPHPALQVYDTCDSIYLLKSVTRRPPSWVSRNSLRGGWSVVKVISFFVCIHFNQCSEHCLLSALLHTTKEMTRCSHSPGFRFWLEKSNMPSALVGEIRQDQETECLRAYENNTKGRAGEWKRQSGDSGFYLNERSPFLSWASRSLAAKWGSWTWEVQALFIEHKSLSDTHRVLVS